MEIVERMLMNLIGKPQGGLGFYAFLGARGYGPEHHLPLRVQGCDIGFFGSTSATQALASHAAAAISKAGTPTVFAWESTTEWQFHWGSHEARPQALRGWAWVGGREAPPPSPPTPGLFLGHSFSSSGNPLLLGN